MGRGTAVGLTRGLPESVQISDWDELDPAGLGDQAALYTFRARVMDREGSADGAVAVFSRGEIVSILILLNGDGRASTDLRQLARVLDARMADARTAPASAPPAAAPPGQPATTVARTASPPLTAAPPSQPAATVARTPGAPGRVLYQDDFADPASGWTRESSEPESRLVGYADGEYQVARLLTRPGWSGAARPSEGFNDLQVEADARLVGPTEGAFVFLGFRRQQNGDHYALEVDPDDGTYRLMRHAQGGPSATVIGRTRSTAIQPGTATNRLGARARGPDLVLFINGQEVGYARDDTFRQGTLALGVGHRGDQQAEARFANLVVFSVE
jgi:hypothetical protein